MAGVNFKKANLPLRREGAKKGNKTTWLKSV
jgi:hypothetical protein